ncbi:MAG: hypothetical protein ACM3Q2_03355, partial [Syntrophothermus sp.]
FLLLGGGVVEQTGAGRFIGSKDRFYPSLVFGVGLEFMFNSTIGLNAKLRNHYLFNDNLDALSKGQYNDYFWNGNIGLIVYLFQ